MRGDIQYVADTILIEKVVALNYAMTKEAGLVSDIFSGVASSVSSFVKSRIDTSSTGALVKSVLRLLEPAIFFRLHPVLGILSTAGQMFGFSITDILSNIVSKIAPKLLSGEQVTSDEVNNVGLSMVGGIATADLLKDLRVIEKKGELLKTAQLFGRRVSPRNQPLGGSFFGVKNAPLLLRIFGFLGQSGRKSLFIGFIVWFIKTILLSAGLLATAGAAKKLIIDDKKEDENKDKPETVEREIKAPVAVSSSNIVGLKDSGRGQKFHNNDNNTAWYIPVINNSIKATLLTWAVDVYPELSGYEDIISRGNAFNKVVSLFEKEYEKGKNFVIVPLGINRRIDVVNYFVKDVYDKIKEKHANA